MSAAREELRKYADRYGYTEHVNALLDAVEREAAEKALREAAVTVRAQAPKYLDTAEDIAVFLALDKAAGEIEPDKEAEHIANTPGTFEVHSSTGKWIGTFAEFKAAEATADRLNEQHPPGGYTWRHGR